MKFYKAVLTLVVALCALDFANADVLTKIESHLSQANILEERGGTISEALRFVDSLGLIDSMSIGGVDKSFAQKGLKGLRTIGSWNDDCTMTEVLDSFESAIKLFEKISANGILRQAAQEAVDKFYDTCGNNILKIMRRKNIRINQIGTMIEEISASKEVGSLCDKMDRTKVDWQYDCINKITSFDSKAFAAGIFAGLKRLDTMSELQNFVNTATSRTELASSLKPIVDAKINDSCFSISGIGGVRKVEVPRCIVSLVKTTSRHVEKVDVELSKRLESALHFCSFLTDDGPWIGRMAKTLAAYAYN